MEMSLIGLPLLLLTAVGLMIAAALEVYALATRQQKLARKIIKGVLIWLGIYTGILLAASFSSKEKIFGLNQEKRFCGFYLDCHLAASVAGVDKTKVVGNPPDQKTARGSFYVVSVKISSDARRATLTFNDPDAVVIDDRGNLYRRSLDAERAIEPSQNESGAFDQSVIAGGSYKKQLVFDLPEGVENPRLLVTKGDPLERLIELFLIGDEDSIFHKKTKFQLEPQETRAEKKRD